MWGNFDAETSSFEFRLGGLSVIFSMDQQVLLTNNKPAEGRAQVYWIFMPKQQDQPDETCAEQETYDTIFGKSEDFDQPCPML